MSVSEDMEKDHGAEESIEGSHNGIAWQRGHKGKDGVWLQLYSSCRGCKQGKRDGDEPRQSIHPGYHLCSRSQPVSEQSLREGEI